MALIEFLEKEDILDQIEVKYSLKIEVKSENGDSNMSIDPIFSYIFP